MLASRPRRMQIAREWPELLHPPRSGSGDWSIVLPFCETLRNAFELMCPVESAGIQRAKNGRCYASLRDSIHMDEVELIERVKSWHAKVGQYVAIRDCLALSFAIDYDREGGNPGRRRTPIGALREQAKPYGREPSDATFEAADGLVSECLRFLGEMSCYDSVDAIVAMPPSNPSKSFDLPAYLASKLGERWGCENLSGAVTTMASRPALKSLALGESSARSPEPCGSIQPGRQAHGAADRRPLSIGGVDELRCHGTDERRLRASARSGLREDLHERRQRQPGHPMIDHAAVQILRLLETPGVGPSKTRKILKLARRKNLGADALLEDAGLLHDLLTDSQIKDLEQNETKTQETVERLEERQVHLLPISSSSYPVQLKTRLGEKAPPLLFVSGNLSLIHRVGVGFCGSRHASEKGLSVAADCSEQLARAQLNVVSGFAAGVDAEAHRAALASGGTTTVVLAEGILRFRLKAELKGSWDPERAVVVSEFPPGLAWSIGNAMQRNRTIGGLSHAMILIEARSQGGSFEAGKTCLALGIPLFAAVYEGMPESATGNEELIQSGAKPLLRSRSTGRANVSPVIAAAQEEERSTKAPATGFLDLTEA